MRTRIAAVAAGTICVLAAASASGGGKARVSFDVVAVSGDAVPPTDGVLDDIGAPTLNESGEVAFGATLEAGVGGTTDANDEVALVARSGVLELVGREGDPAPGTPPGATFDEFRFQSIDDAGTVYQSAALASQVRGIWKLPRGDVPSVHFLASSEVNPNSTPISSAAGHQAFFANNGDDVFAVAPGGDVVPLARAGDPAPGILPSAPFRFFGAFPTLNRSGEVVVPGYFDEDVPDGTRYPSGIWRGAIGEPLALVARTGAPAPGGPGGYVFSDLVVRDLGENGTFGVWGGLGIFGWSDPTYSGVWLAAPDGLRLVALEGSPAPTGRPRERFSEFSSGVFVDDAEQVVFIAHLLRGAGSTTAGNDHALWRMGGDGRPLLAREGQALGDDSAARIRSFDEPTLSDSGAVLCHVRLRGSGVTPANDDALLYFPPSGKRIVLVREGARFKVGPGDRRRIRKILVGSGTEQGYGRRFLNDAGQVTFALEFANGTSAAVVATIGNQP